MFITFREYVETAESRELKLYADNDSETYFKHYIPVAKNMSRKLEKGIFDNEKAVTGFLYVIDFAAKKYCREFGGIWHKVFTKADREAAAAAMVEDFLNEIH